MDRDLLTIDPREVVEDDDALFALLREVAPEEGLDAGKVLP